jgi:hypothetical protein
MHKTLVLWDHVSVVVRVGTMLIGVQGSRQFRRQPQVQIKTSTAVTTTMHLLRQGRTKLVVTPKKQTKTKLKFKSGLERLRS